VVVWLVNTEDSVEDAMQFVEQGGSTLPVLMDEDKEFYNSIQREGAPAPYPVEVVVGRDGFIHYVATEYSAADIRDAIQSALDE